MGKKYTLVTGCSGFIGRYIINKFTSLRKGIIGIDTEPTDFKNSFFRFHQVDIMDKPTVDSLFSMYNISKVIHLARGNPIQDRGMLLNLLEVCSTKNIDKFVLASDYHVYGNASLANESTEPVPLDPNSFMQLQNERLCSFFSKLYDLDIACLRLFEVYGPGMPRDNIIYQTITNLKNDKEAMLNGDEGQTRDFIYISDAVDLIHNCTIRRQESKIEIFNIGIGFNIRLSKMVDIIANLLNKDSEIIYNLDKHNIDSCVADTELVKNTIRWRPTINVSKGLSMTVRWYSENCDIV